MSGQLGGRPLVHLLVFANARSLTGTLELAAPSGDGATVVFQHGRIVKTRTVKPTAFLADILCAMEFLSDEEREASMNDFLREQVPHGRVLLARGAVTAEQLAAGLAEQTARKFTHLFSLGPDTTFDFTPDVDKIEGYGAAPPIPIDVLPLVWRGLVSNPPVSHVHDVVSKAIGMVLRLSPAADLARFRFPPDILAATARFAEGITPEALVAQRVLSPAMLEALIHCLIITGQVTRTDAAPLSTRIPASWSGMHAAVPPPRSAPGGAAASNGAAGNGGGPPSQQPVPVSHRGSPAVPASIKMPVGLHDATPISQQRPLPSSSPAIQRPLPNSSPGIPMPGLSSEPIPVSMRGPPGSQPVPHSQRLPDSRRPEDRERVFADRAAAIQGENLFKRLSLGRDASDEQIERAFATVARMWDISTVQTPSDAARASAEIISKALREARESLLDPARRKEAERAFLGIQQKKKVEPADDVAKNSERGAAASGTELVEAKACMARGELERAERLARMALKADENDSSALALVALLEAQRPANQDESATRARILMLDRAISYNSSCEEAYYYRAKLHGRLQNHASALRDLKRVTSLNPKNQDAVRELRVYEMRARNGTIDTREDARKANGLFGRFKK
jgi:tetratricopeptide (TPR) repeat protein